MANPSPFQFLESVLQSTRFPTPPAWMVEEAQRRCVLLVNHVLMQEPQAMQRLVRQKGRVIFAQWREFSFKVVVTPAGLFDLAEPQMAVDLTVLLNEDSPIRLAQALLKGEKPTVRIEGDVQLAAELNWLADNVRWDLEEDLARVLGDAPAHWLMQAVKGAADGLRSFLSARGIWRGSVGPGTDLAGTGERSAAASSGTAA